MNRKGLISVFVGFLMLFSMYSAGTMQAVAIEPQQTISVGIVYSTGGLGDLSFNDAAKRGIDAALVNHANLEVTEACESDCDDTDVTAAIGTLASSGEHDVVIGIGFTAGDGITAAAEANTDQKFMIIDAFVDLPNVASIEFKEEEGSFLAGAMAAMVSESGKLGFLGGLNIPLINRFAAGYRHGAQYINPDATVKVVYSPDPDNPWGDLAGGQTIGETMIEEDGIDIIFAAAGGTGIGVINAVAAANTAGATTYAIGVDSDQDYLSEGNVLTSMVKRVDVAVETHIDSVVADTWAAGGVKLGLAEDGVGISVMNYTQAEANAIYEGTTTRIQKVNQLATMVKNGDIVVSDSLSSGDEEDTPLNFIPILASFVALFVLRRKFRN